MAQTTLTTVCCMGVPDPFDPYRYDLFCYASQVSYAVNRLERSSSRSDRNSQVVAETRTTISNIAGSAAAQTLDDAVFAMVSSWAARPIILAALGVFPGPPVVVWAAPVVKSRCSLARRAAHRSASIRC